MRGGLRRKGGIGERDHKGRGTRADGFGASLFGERFIEVENE
jgi:hypothetical protein